LRCELKAFETARGIVTALEDKKGEDILLLDISEVTVFADYFVIVSGTSDRMLDSLADSVLETAKKEYKIIGKREGYARDGWVLVDLGDVIVHLFSPEQRSYYQLEQLWEQGKTLLRLQ
jgi:ribosome-associated protein